VVTHLVTDVKAVPYPVQGSSWGALMRSVDERAELVQLGGDGDRPFDGRTSWRLRWKQRTRRLADRCETTVELTLKVTTFLPEWSTPVTSLQPRWTKSLAQLTAHEQGHQDLSLQVARDLEVAVQALHPAPPCVRVTELDALGTQFVDRGIADHVRYDELTDHGTRQERWTGTLPPP
jgi:predicted secreted Zn-dependent protease